MINEGWRKRGQRTYWSSSAGNHHEHKKSITIYSTNSLNFDKKKFHPKKYRWCSVENWTQTINVSLRHSPCQMMRNVCFEKFPECLATTRDGGIGINIVFMTVCKRSDWIRRERRNPSMKRRAINIKDIFLANWIISGRVDISGSLSIVLLFPAWLHHAC